ncbi:cytochrome P450 family protein [Bradyrhizobium elkanii USDA 61]|nr:cytochrome P450 family protein [Bradyrhizobium elkanii USDA 61]
MPRMAPHGHPARSAYTIAPRPLGCIGVSHDGYSHGGARDRLLRGRHRLRLRL